MYRPLKLLMRRSRFLFLAGVVCAVVSLLISFLTPLEYKASAQVLIISQSRYGVDPYTVVKSAERVGENLAQVMKTTDFYKKVKSQTQYDLDWSRFDKLKENKKRKLWQKSVEPSVVYGTGVLNISTYHPDKAQAKMLAAATAQALVEKGWEYVGGDVAIKLVNDPVVGILPSRPNLLLNALAGFLVGLLAAGVLVIYKR